MPYELWSSKTQTVGPKEHGIVYNSTVCVALFITHRFVCVNY